MCKNRLRQYSALTKGYTARMKPEIPARLVVMLTDFYQTSTDDILNRTNTTTPYPAKK